MMDYKLSFAKSYFNSLILFFLLVLTIVLITSCSRNLNNKIKGKYVEVIHISANLDLYDKDMKSLAKLKDNAYFDSTFGVKHVYTSHCSPLGDKNSLILTRKNYKKAKTGTVVMIDYTTRLDLGFGGSKRIIKIFEESENFKIPVKLAVSPFDVFYNIHGGKGKHSIELKNGKHNNTSYEISYKTKNKISKSELKVRESHVVKTLKEVPVRLITNYPPCE